MAEKDPPSPPNKEGSMPKPTIGRIVLYTLRESDAERINNARDHAPLDHTGSQRIRHGSTVYAGEEYPMLIVRVYSEIAPVHSPNAPKPTHAVNGQVFLDGNDTLWVSAFQGQGPGMWRWPPHVEEVWPVEDAR